MLAGPAGNGLEPRPMRPAPAVLRPLFQAGQEVGPLGAAVMHEFYFLSPWTCSVRHEAIPSQLAIPDKTARNDSMGHRF